MRILYISHKLPYPLSDGGKLRVFNHIKHLSKKHEIISLSFIKNKNELKEIDKLKKFCRVETVLLPRWKSLINSFFGLFSDEPLRVHYLKDRRFKEKAKRLSKEADLIIIQAMRMSQYGFYPEKSILDIVDTPSLQIKRALKYDNFIWKLIWSIELPRILNYEKSICKKFKKILVSSEADKMALGCGSVLKNGTEIENIKRNDPEGNNIMFLGNMGYKPNADAVKYFVNDIFPLVKRKIKDAKFYIVGKNPAKVRRYASKDIIVTGFVNDPSEYFLRCKVFAAPLRLGSGIQNKVLEALSYKVPIITTSIVNEGVEAKEGKEIIVADNAREFAEKIINLIQNKELRERLSNNGKKVIVKNYLWSKICKRLDNIIDNDN